MHPLNYGFLVSFLVMALTGLSYLNKAYFHLMTSFCWLY